MIAEAIREAHAEAALRDDDERSTLRRKLKLAFIGLAIVGSVGAYVAWELTGRLNAPDQVIKEDQAVRLKVFGLSEPAHRKQPQAGDVVIPPRDHVGKSDDKKSEPTENFPQFKKNF